jgi:toxin ParE2
MLSYDRSHDHEDCSGRRRMRPRRRVQRRQRTGQTSTRSIRDWTGRDSRLRFPRRALGERLRLLAWQHGCLGPRCFTTRWSSRRTTAQSSRPSCWRASTVRRMRAHRRPGPTRFAVASIVPLPGRPREHRGPSSETNCEVAGARDHVHSRHRGRGGARRRRRLVSRDARPGVATRFREAIERAFAELSETPDAFQILEEWRGVTLRRVVVRGFPYHIVYGHLSGGLWVFAVAHLHRRPGYWRTRLPSP